MSVLLPQPLGPVMATNSPPRDFERDAVHAHARSVRRSYSSGKCYGARSSLPYPPAAKRAQMPRPISRSWPRPPITRSSNKPPFLLVHPTKPDGPRTLWGELRQLFAFELANGGQVSIVNRLDRETSGLVLVAKTCGGGAAVRFAHAKAAHREGISRDGLGLAGLGRAHRRRAARSAKARRDRRRFI